MTAPLGDGAGQVPVVSYKGAASKEMVMVDPDDLVATQVANLPSSLEVNKMIAAVLAKSLREILTGKLAFKSAGEAARVTKDYVAIARDLNLLGAEAAVAKASTDEERKEAFEELKAAAQKRILELRE